MKKRTIILLLSFIPIVFTAGAVDKFKEIEKRFNKKSETLEQKYKSHSSKLDAKFANHLKQQWLDLEFEKGKKKYKKPKPVKLPEAPPALPEKAIDKTPVIKAVVTPITKPPVVPVPIVKPSQDEHTVKFSFLDKNVTVPIPKQVHNIRLSSINNKGIAKFWEDISSIPHTAAFDQITKYHNNLLKNDWAFLMFLELLSGKVYPKSENRQILYTWFLLCKSDYRARVGYTKTKILLLLPATTQIFGKSFFTLDRIKFYRLSAIGMVDASGSVYTYPGQYPGADKKLNLKISHWPDVDKKIKKRNLSFSYKGKKYPVKVEYQNDIIVFVKNYPQTDIDAYAAAPLSVSSQNSLLKELAKILKGKTETEAINILLAFVQNAFNYKTDDQQFGHEKWFFAEETLNYPYSDCEDRSIIFARLVKRLLNMDVVVLHYPGHIATAVKFSKTVGGDRLKYKNSIYTVCDPTYINATYGMAMPQFKKVSPEVTAF